MPSLLVRLETKRSKLLRQFRQLGDLRPGSISAASRRCGKPTCHCAQPSDRGHTPQIRLIRKVNGKSVAESFASFVAFQKAQREVAEFRRFQKLSAELVAINEQICRVRPVEQETLGWTPQAQRLALRSIPRPRSK